MSRKKEGEWRGRRKGEGESGGRGWRESIEGQVRIRCLERGRGKKEGQGRRKGRAWRETRPGEGGSSRFRQREEEGEEENGEERDEPRPLDLWVGDFFFFFLPTDDEARRLDVAGFM